MAFPASPPRFPLLAKVDAIAAVLLALTLALEAVSGIVHERCCGLDVHKKSVRSRLLRPVRWQ